MKISVCGLLCDECEFYDTKCAGCYSVKGSTFWAVEMMPSEVCPIFLCAVNRKQLKSCGECKYMPCDLFLEMKDPALTEEEHKRVVALRISRLKQSRIKSKRKE